MGEVVSVSRAGSVAIVTVDQPPVNVMSQAMRIGLVDAFKTLGADSSVKAIVLAAAGRTFISGADLKEFDTGVLPPKHYDLFEQIETLKQPVVAAMFGTAMGAGVEIALACHYRVASPDAKVGFPEVTLGIIPGAGGTQRLPRLIGATSKADSAGGESSPSIRNALQGCGSAITHDHGPERRTGASARRRPPWDCRASPAKSTSGAAERPAGRTA